MLANVIEGKGVATVTVSIMRKISEDVRAPRTVFARFPLGHPFGEAHKPYQHSAVLKSALMRLVDAQTPGTIFDLPYKWRRDEDFV